MRRSFIHIIPESVIWYLTMICFELDNHLFEELTHKSGFNRPCAVFMYPRFALGALDHVFQPALVAHEAVPVTEVRFLCLCNISRPSLCCFLLLRGRPISLIHTVLFHGLLPFLPFRSAHCLLLQCPFVGCWCGDLRTFSFRPFSGGWGQNGDFPLDGWWHNTPYILHRHWHLYYGVIMSGVVSKWSVYQMDGILKLLAEDQNGVVTWDDYLFLYCFCCSNYFKISYLWCWNCHVRYSILKTIKSKVAWHVSIESISSHVICRCLNCGHGFDCHGVSDVVGQSCFFDMQQWIWNLAISPFSRV